MGTGASTSTTCTPVACAKASESRLAAARRNHSAQPPLAACLSLALRSTLLCSAWLFQRCSSRHGSACSGRLAVLFVLLFSSDFPFLCFATQPIAMSRRLGGGRILGSGKSLGPTPPARSSSPFAPSESTVSVASSSISPPASGSLADLSQDIGSSISVGAQPKGSSADPSSLLCPICSEEMVRSRESRAVAYSYLPYCSSLCSNSTAISMTPTKSSLPKNRTKSRHGSTNRSSKRSASSRCR